jgi:hypothetical protein
LGFEQSGHTGFASAADLAAVNAEVEKTNVALGETNKNVSDINTQLVATNADLQTLDKDYWGNPEGETTEAKAGFRETTNNRLAAEIAEREVQEALLWQHINQAENDIAALKYDKLRVEATGDDELTIYRDVAVYTTANATNLDEGAFEVGRDYYIYLCHPASIVFSTNGTAPAGFDGTTSRKIGGFHYGVCRRNLTTGSVFDGIVPRSIWTDAHRPKCAPEGMVYISSGVWADIYQNSDDGAGGMRSVYDVQPIASINWYVAAGRLAAVDKRMLTYQEWVMAAAGSPPGTSSGNGNAWSTGSEPANTGFVRNAVSTFGCRDCVGNLWEWLSDIIASGLGTQEWQDAMSGQGQGQMWLNANNDFRALLAGGSHWNGSLIGARSATNGFSPWQANASFGVRGACESL